MVAPTVQCSALRACALPASPIFRARPLACATRFVHPKGCGMEGGRRGQRLVLRARTTSFSARAVVAPVLVLRARTTSFSARAVVAPALKLYIRRRAWSRVSASSARLRTPLDAQGRRERDSLRCSPPAAAALLETSSSRARRRAAPELPAFESRCGSVRTLRRCGPESGEPTRSVAEVRIPPPGFTRVSRGAAG